MQLKISIVKTVYMKDQKWFSVAEAINIALSDSVCSGHYGWMCFYLNIRPILKNLDKIRPVEKANSSL
jgi:hypothetical protein